MKQLLALATVIALGCCKPSFGLSEKEQKLVSANNDFALRLLKALPSSQTENVFFSPYSLSTALGMTLAGARGTTHQEMSQVLGYTQAGLNEADIKEAFTHQNNRLQADAARVGLEVANSAAVQQDFQILDTYYAQLNQSFNAHVFNVDFVHQGAQAVGAINAWVKQATHDKIPKLFEQPLGTDTRLVLVNAIVYKGLWASQFVKNVTHKKPFYNGGIQSAEVDMMFQKLKTNYAFDRSLQANVVELLYRGGNYSMIILLPSQRTGVEALKQALTVSKLDLATSSFRNGTIDLYLPKFELDKKNDLKDNLTYLGLRQMFGNADLSGMTGNRQLVVSDVVQRAVVKVDEEGTEAAAATAVVVGIRTSTRIPVVKVDHPFLFFIRNRTTKEIFFAGQVNKL
ncbi:iripin-2-like [Haemaphysalis longicornis]